MQSCFQKRSLPSALHGDECHASRPRYTHNRWGANDRRGRSYSYSPEPPPRGRGRPAGPPPGRQDGWRGSGGGPPGGYGTDPRAARPGPSQQQPGSAPGRYGGPLGGQQYGAPPQVRAYIALGRRKFRTTAMPPAAWSEPGSHRYMVPALVARLKCYANCTVRQDWFRLLAVSPAGTAAAAAEGQQDPGAAARGGRRRAGPRRAARTAVGG